MTLESFCKMYEADVRPRLRKNTWLTEESIIECKILSYLEQLKLLEITAKDWYVDQVIDTFILMES